MSVYICISPVCLWSPSYVGGAIGQPLIDICLAIGKEMVGLLTSHHTHDNSCVEMISYQLFSVPIYFIPV